MTQDPDRFSADAQRSSRDLEAVRRGLERALAARVPGDGHAVGPVSGTSANGMSSETLLFDASWTDRGQPRTEQLVARVAELTDVPVPPPWWCEANPEVIGSPFFVMGRVEGQVPTPPAGCGPTGTTSSSGGRSSTSPTTRAPGYRSGRCSTCVPPAGVPSRWRWRP